MSAWQQEYLDSGLWRSIFYTEFATVRAAILMPILVLYLLVLSRITSVRGINDSTVFNKIVTFGLGAFITTAPLRASTPLVTAIVGITILNALSLLLNMLYYYGVLPQHSIAAKPTLLVARGHMIQPQMRKLFMRQDKVQSELRKKGHASLEDVFAMIMEPDGTCSIITNEAAHNRSTLSLLEPVDGYQRYLAEAAPAGHSRQQNGV
jgi:uncharacterized membrane protein YcaP (DUF421 family)